MMAGYAGGGPGVDIVALALEQVDAIVRTLATATTEQDFTAIQATLHRHIANSSTAAANALEGAKEITAELEQMMAR
jgi:hypothetical protein